MLDRLWCQMVVKVHQISSCKCKPLCNTQGGGQNGKGYVYIPAKARRNLEAALRVVGGHWGR